MVFRFSNTPAGAGVEPQLRPQRAGHDGRDHRRGRPGQLLRLGRRAARRRAEPPAAGGRAAGDGATGGSEAELPAGREGQGLRGDESRRSDASGSRAVRRATATSRAWPPTRQVETFVAARLEIDSWRWAGVPFYVRAGKALARGRDRGRGRVPRPAPPALRRGRRHRARTATWSASASASTTGSPSRCRPRPPGPTSTARTSTSTSTSPPHWASGRTRTSACSTTRSPVTPPLRPRGRRRADVARRPAGARRARPGAPLLPRLVGARGGRPHPARRPWFDRRVAEAPPSNRLRWPRDDDDGAVGLVAHGDLTP